MIFIFITGIFLLLAYCLLILYYRQGWISIPEFKVHENFQPKTKLSIIIPARNEELHIKTCLDSICIQSYPTDLFEILVIDDHSTDRTADFVRNYPSKNVRLLSLKEMTSGTSLNSYKKKAIELAIAQSSGELIIATDADCIAPAKWLITIASFYETTNASFIAMPVTFKSPNNFLEVFQSLDFMTLQGITGASVHKKIHSMCNGANLAYTKKAFAAVNGFKGIDNIASGDDMLLMHKIYQQQPDKVFFLKSKEVIVQTQPMKTVNDFFNQRIRWASKADKYDDKRIIAVLFLVYFFNVLLAILPVVTAIKNFQFSIINFQFSAATFWLFLIISKTIIELIFLFPVTRFFSQQRLLLFFPIAQPFHILYTIIAGWLGKFGSYQWKGREVK